MIVVAVQAGWFIGAGLVMWLGLMVLAGAWGVMAAQADHAAEREVSDLPVPAAARMPRAEVLVSSHPAVPRPGDRVSRRGGQRDRVGAQERAARDALRCHGGRVDASPVRCPIESGRG